MEQFVNQEWRRGEHAHCQIKKFQRVLHLTLIFFCLLLLLSQVSRAQESPSDSDLALTSKLRKAFQQVPRLDEVTLEVRGGVAVLRGTVPSLEASNEAVQLASKLDGILTVDNGLKIDTDLANRVSPALSGLYSKARSFLHFAPLMGVSLIVFLLFVTAASALNRWNWLFNQISKNVFIQDLLKQIVSFGSAVVGALVALEILDATALVGAVLGTAGVFGVAIGFAFRDLAENSLASLLLSLRQPFSPNDHVVIDGQEGKVVRLTSRATVLLTLDGNHLRIPNAAVFKAVILNYSKNPERRFTFLVGIDTEENLPKAQHLAVSVLRAAPGVLDDPPPLCLIEALGDSNVSLKIIGWVDQTQNEYLKVKSEAIRRIKEAYDQAGIFMPEPIYKVKLEQAEARETQKVRAKTEPQDVEVDLTPETHLEKRIEEERHEVEDDLLQMQGKQE